VTDHDQYFAYLMQRSALGSLYRRHLLYPRLARRLVGRSLDVGCGVGDFLRYRPGTVGVDVNPRTVEYCRSLGLDAHLMAPDRLPFDAAAFDSALLDNVLEHIEDRGPLLAELRRVLRPGGRLLVGVPGLRGWDSDPDHKIAYDEASLTAAVEAGGFRVTEIFHTPLWRSAWLSRTLRQYCVFALFTVA